MIDASDSTRSGWSIATRWAIIPPSEAPTRWARSTPRWSSRPTASAAMSESGYGGSASPAATRLNSGAGTSPSTVERPASRLSNRITWRPAAASRSHSSSGQLIICEPRPITSSTVGSAGSPKVS